MTGEIVVIIMLLAVVALQAFIVWKLIEQHNKKESELLNRVMAKDYAQYVQAEVVREQVKKPLTDEEIYAMQQERGIPV
jgi:HAMP domain-containing protein